MRRVEKKSASGTGVGLWIGTKVGYVVDTRGRSENSLWVESKVRSLRTVDREKERIECRCFFPVDWQKDLVSL